MNNVVLYHKINAGRKMYFKGTVIDITDDKEYVTIKNSIGNNDFLPISKVVGILK